MADQTLNKSLLTTQLFSIPLDETRYLIYAPLKGISFIANPALVNKLVDYSVQPNTAVDLPSFLTDSNFFQPDPEPIDTLSDNQTHYNAVILFLTNQCNLRCTYCYASAGDYPRRTMSWPIAKTGIDRVMREALDHHAPEMSLGFHGGGEPTLNLKIMKQAVEYAYEQAARHNLPLHVTGSFNGCWTDTVLQFILKNFTDISLSFDGLPIVQNQQRPTKGDGDSFQRVTNTLRALDTAHLNYGIRLTVTKDSLPYLVESTSFICQNFRPKTIQIEPVFATGRALVNHLTVDDLNEFISQFPPAYQIAEQAGIRLFYSGARLDAVTTRFCQAASRALVITPDGDVTTCFEIYSRDHPLSEYFIIGHYDKNSNDFVIDESRRKRHLQRTVTGISYCDNCFCKWHCAGDCASKTITAEEPDKFQPTDRCYVNQELTKYLLLDRIKKSGGLLWSRSRPINQSHSEEVSREKS